MSYKFPFLQSYKTAFICICIAYVIYIFDAPFPPLFIVYNIIRTFNIRIVLYNSLDIYFAFHYDLFYTMQSVYFLKIHCFYIQWYNRFPLNYILI